MKVCDVAHSVKLVEFSGPLIPRAPEKRSFLNVRILYAFIVYVDVNGDGYKLTLTSTCSLHKMILAQKTKH